MSLILETSRLIFKPILESELDTLHSILVDPYVRKELCDRLNHDSFSNAKILDYGFNELDYDYLSASCARPNRESQQVATRLGMKQMEERIINGNPILFF
jgi:RimJ/RimL family protein N-acetyltransferase